MTSLFLHNALTDLSSRQFLALYALACIAVLFLAHWIVRSTDRSDSGGWEALPRDLDAYEIAYLRGDLNELVRYVVFDLIRSGYLELVPAEGKKAASIGWTATAPVVETLSPPAQIVYAFFAEPHSADELFASSVPVNVAAAYAGERQKLEARQLFASPAKRAASRAVRIAGALVIIALAADRLWFAAVMHHRNIGFLLLIGIVSLVLLFPLTAVRRLSRRGRRYLRGLRAALPATPQNTTFASPAFPLVVAAGGMVVLAGTPYAGLSQTFQKQAASDGSGSSGGCSSACSSGSGGGGSSGGSCSSGGCGGGCGG